MFSALILLLMITSAGCNKIPKTAPLLSLSLSSGDSQEQRIQAIQLTTSWNYKTGGYEADSFHPLQLDYDRFSKATLHLINEVNEIKMAFSGNYPPHSVSVQRWNAALLGDAHSFNEALDKGESVDVKGTTIYVPNDGYDYIYEVFATWQNGSSYYTFCSEINVQGVTDS